MLLAYENYLRLSRRDRRVEATTKLSQAELAAVEKSEMATSRRPRGDKDRPCPVLALVTTLEDGTPIVRVLPITPSPPGRTHEAIEIPPATKCRRGLDDERSWIVLSESNRFPLARTGYPVQRQRQRLFRAVAAHGVCRGQAPQFPRRTKNADDEEQPPYRQRADRLSAGMR